MKITSLFIKEIRELILTARATVLRGTDLVQVHTSFEIGRRIVQEEQQGKSRAEYGKQILKELSLKLCAEFGRGFSEDSLSNMRKFYLVFKNRNPISETASRKLKPARNTLIAKFGE